jgi:hypothetical protein
MKFRSKSSLAQGNKGASSRTKLDLLKSTALLITILGTLAWIAGEAFNQGYWGAAHHAGPISPISLQSMAFLGFVGPYKNWLWGVAAASMLGPYIALLSIERKNKSIQSFRWLASLRRWWKERFQFDKEILVFAIVLTLLGLLIFALIILPLLAWVIGAAHQGSNTFVKQVCELRITRKLPTVIKLADGRQISGKILDRSDKLVIVMDGAAIQVLTVAEKAQLIDSTSLQDIKCFP